MKRLALFHVAPLLGDLDVSEDAETLKQEAQEIFKGMVAVAEDNMVVHV